MSTHLLSSNNKLSTGQEDTQWMVHGFTETQSDPDVKTVSRLINHMKDHMGGHTGGKPYNWDQHWRSVGQ